MAFFYKRALPTISPFPKNKKITIPAYIFYAMYKLINDPIYGFIHMPKGVISELMDHKIYQRLRRIMQLGVVQYVFPNATHSRFSHTLGALHLMQNAVNILRKKGTEITEEEEQAVLIAILLHDLGHSPFSHSLEFQLLRVHHESISVALMEYINAENSALQGALTLALKIFKNEYHKPFLHQLVSSQLDMDRLDYLTRDSYFTGVAEGKVGYQRLIETMQVVNNELVVEYKGIYAIENFLISRRLMYWQVYLHKAVVGASAMLDKIIDRARFLIFEKGENFNNKLSDALFYFLRQYVTDIELKHNTKEILHHFINLDDNDIWQALKVFAQHEDFILSTLSQGFLDRKLFKVTSYEMPIEAAVLEKIQAQMVSQFNISPEDAHYLAFDTKQTNQAYNTRKQSIKILTHEGKLRPISDWQEHNIQRKEVVKFYLCQYKL